MKKVLMLNNSYYVKIELFKYFTNGEAYEKFL